MQQNKWSRLNNTALLLVTIFILSFAIKYLFKVNYLEDYDAIDFAFALKEYDLAAYKPHFPGYPVYVFIGRIFLYVFGNETFSLIMQNILFGSLSSVVVYLIAYELFDNKTALLSAIIFTVNPAVSILSDSVNSDITAMFFLLLFLYYLIKAERCIEKRVKYLFISSLSFGLTIGIRISYAPFIVLWLAYCRFFALFRLKDYDDLLLDDNSFLASVSGLTVGVALWLAPLLIIVGARYYYYEGLRFITGHFNDWGGTFVTDPSIIKRMGDLLWQLFPKGLGTYYTDTPLLRLIPTAVFAVSIIWLLRKKLCKPKIFLLYVIPYLIWIFFAQNLQKVRHVLPLIPILIIYLSYAISQVFLKDTYRKYSYGIVVIALVLMSADTAMLLSEHKKAPPPPYSVMKYLQKNTLAADSVLYCGESERFFVYYYPEYPVKRFKTSKEVLFDLDGSLVVPENVFVTSSVKDIESLDVKEVITFSRSRYIYNPYNKITLYKLKIDSINLLEF